MNTELNRIVRTVQEYYTDIKAFKINFIDRCRVDHKFEAYKIWSHWLLRNLCRKKQVYHLIPDPEHVRTDTYIIGHLLDKHFIGGKDNVKTFYDSITDSVQVMYEKYNDLLIMIYHDEHREILKKLNNMTTQKIRNSTNEYIYKFFDHFTPYSEQIHNKLIQMYRQKDLHTFYFDMFALGFNYYIIDGNSLQWSIPRNVFRYMSSVFKCHMEFFASPMNANLPLYCSLFRSERVFGAINNFFNIDRKQIMEGVYEINPPFINEIFDNSCNIVFKLIQNSENKGRELMFIYIMPDWVDCNTYNKLSTSLWCIKHIHLEKDKHTYYQISNCKYVMATFDAHIFIIGTSRAREKYSQSGEMKDDNAVAGEEFDMLKTEWYNTSSHLIDDDVITK